MGGHRPPSPWALFDIWVVGLGVLTVVPIGRGQRLDCHWREGFDINTWGWSHHHRWVAIGLPVGSEGDDQARANKDPRPSIPMRPVMPMASITMLMASIPLPMASISMPFLPIPTTVGVPWHRTDQEQRRQYDECPHPLLPCSHDYHLFLRAHMRMFPGSVPTISPALPVQSHVGAYAVSGGLTCVRLILLTAPPLLLTTIPVNFWGVCGQTIYVPLSIPSFFPSDVEQG